MPAGPCQAALWSRAWGAGRGGGTDREGCTTLEPCTELWRSSSLGAGQDGGNELNGNGLPQNEGFYIVCAFFPIFTWLWHFGFSPGGGGREEAGDKKNILSKSRRTR